MNQTNNATAPASRAGRITFRWRGLQAALLSSLVAGMTDAASITPPLVYASDDPEVEMYFYPWTTSNGLGSVRDRGATFSWYTPQPGFPDQSGSGTDPGRRGSFIVAGDTSGAIPMGLEPSRYRIESVRATLTLLASIGETPGGPYDGTPDDTFAVLGGTDDDPGHPVEMWGVGFDGDYETFGFDGQTEPEYFNEGDRRWPVSGGVLNGPYEVFPTDPTGADVSNNMIEGGYSATAPSNTNAVFDPTPFAVGKVYDEEGAELAPGAQLGQGDVFEFEVDLSQPGVTEYVQSTLSRGYLGFFFSSLHAPNGHGGDVYYPDFYLDNVAGGPNPYGDGPTLEVAVTILDESFPPGDYDRDGQVNESDYDLWRVSYGAVVAPTEGADGNGDGVVDAADYTAWRDGYALAAAATISVPEPTGAQLVGIVAATTAFFGWMRWFIGPLSPDEDADE